MGTTTLQPASHFAAIAKMADMVAKDAGAFAGLLNTAPITLASAARECEATGVAMQQFEAFLQGQEGSGCSGWGSRSSEFISTTDALARSVAADLSTVVDLLGRMGQPASQGVDGADGLVIVWNEDALKKCVESLRVSRCSLEFLLQCAPSDDELDSPSSPLTESPLVSPAVVNLGNRLRLSTIAASPPTASPGRGRMSRVGSRNSCRVVEEKGEEPEDLGKVQRRARQFCQLLHLAIDKKNGPAVLELLHQRVDPNTPAPGSTLTPIHRALNCKDEYTTTLLAAAGANIEALDDTGSTVLMRGIRNGFSDRFIAVLCEMGANVDSFDNMGASPLHLVAASDRDDGCIDILVEAGADPNLKDAHGLTPLATAIVKGNQVVVRQLVQRGADIEARVAGEKTALQLAIANRDVNMCKRLVDLGVFLDGRFGDHTPLTYAISLASFDVAEMLIDSGADVNRRSRTGHFALLAAVSAGSEKLTSKLLSHSAAVDMASSCGYYPVHMAAHKNRPDILRLLAKCGSEVDATTANGETPLWLAVKIGNRACVESLVKLGADVNRRGPSGDTTLSMALRRGNLPVAKILISAGAAAGSTITDNSGYHTTPLHFAAAQGLDDIVNAMAHAGANLNLKVWPGYTPLFSAARAGNVSTARLLLERGALLQAESAAGEKALFLCTAHMDMIRFLLSRGININHRDHHGATALHHAGLHGHHAAAKLLLQHGAKSVHANAVYDCLDDFKIGSRYRQGTPAGVARQKGHFKVAKLIDGWKYRL